MEPDTILARLKQAHRGRHVVRIRAVNPSGNTVDIVGFVMEVRWDGSVRVGEGDARRGRVHDLPRTSILEVERIHDQ